MDAVDTQGGVEGGSRHDVEVGDGEDLLDSAGEISVEDYLSSGLVGGIRLEGSGIGEGSDCEDECSEDDKLGCIVGNPH